MPEDTRPSHPKALLVFPLLRAYLFFPPIFKSQLVSPLLGSLTQPVQTVPDRPVSSTVNTLASGYKSTALIVWYLFHYHTIAQREQRPWQASLSLFFFPSAWLGIQCKMCEIKKVDLGVGCLV